MSREKGSDLEFREVEGISIRKRKGKNEEEEIKMGRRKSRGGQRNHVFIRYIMQKNGGAEKQIMERFKRATIAMKKALSYEKNFLEIKNEDVQSPSRQCDII